MNVYPKIRKVSIFHIQKTYGFLNMKN